MAIIIKTINPSDLLSSIRHEIENKKIVTWSFDNDGDFTHTPEQWIYKAWLRPKIYQGELRFGLVPRKDIKISTVVYSVYHGRFIEMLLDHFDKKFVTAAATSQKDYPDSFD